MQQSQTLNQQAFLRTATELLLTPYGLTQQHLQQALNALHAHKIDDADLYFQYSKAENWSLEDGIVKNASFSIDQGVGVRCVSGEKTAFAYSDSLAPDSLLAAAKTVRSISDQGQQRQIQLSSKHGAAAQLYQPLDPITSLSSRQKIALLEKIERLARSKDARIVQVIAELGCEYDVILLSSGNGQLHADIRPLVRVSIRVIAEQQINGNLRRESGNSGGGGRYDLSYFTDELLEQYINQAVNSACINLAARPAPAGQMPVVLGAGWPGILLHEAVGHGLEADFNRKGSSVFSQMLGQRVAAKGVTVIDDGSIANRRGSLNIDDEGQPTQRNVLIEDGILKGYLQDRTNARLMGCAPTGNGRRESYAHLPIPRMTNTYMLGGNHSHEEIIASVQQGIFAPNFSGGQVDITSGKFVFCASEAYWIENGKIQYPIKGATIIGSGIESLKHISMIGNNLELDQGIGVCGKDGQSVPVGVGQPTIRIDNLTVGGTN